MGTDFYSLYPNFRGLQNLYNAHPGKPFVLAEWALENGDDVAWVDQLFSFISYHVAIATPTRVRHLAARWGMI